MTESFGVTVARRRYRLNLTRVALAQILGCHDDTIAQWETGRHSPSAARRVEVLRELRRLEKMLVVEILAEHAVEHPWNIPRRPETRANKGI